MQELRQKRCSCRINRNIVECKAIFPDPKTTPTIVLIETLWNVKLNRKDYIFDVTNVLIETLWNVKNANIGLATGSVSRINRNIVECKVARPNA